MVRIAGLMTNPALAGMPSIGKATALSVIHIHIHMGILCFLGVVSLCLNLLGTSAMS